MSREQNGLCEVMLIPAVFALQVIANQVESAVAGLASVKLKARKCSCYSFVKRSLSEVPYLEGSLIRFPARPFAVFTCMELQTNVY